MNKQPALYTVILIVLTAWAIYAAQSASHRGELATPFVMLFIAVIFWKKVQKSS